MATFIRKATFILVIGLLGLAALLIRYEGVTPRVFWLVVAVIVCAPVASMAVYRLRRRHVRGSCSMSYTQAKAKARQLVNQQPTPPKPVNPQEIPCPFTSVV